jgi:hypothetical protein
MKNYQPVFQVGFLFSKFCVRIEKKTKVTKWLMLRQRWVNSSIRLSLRYQSCSEVITNRQKPSRLADVRNICWEVLLAEIILV